MVVVRSHASRWGAYAALGIALTLLGQSASAQPPHQDASTAHTSRVSNPGPKGAGHPSSTAPIESSAQRIAGALEAKNAYDHSAQGQQDAHEAAKAARDAANWAGGVLVAAWAETLVTLAGVVLVALTLGAARRSAKAAEKNIEETRRIGEAQVRAYVAISDVTVSFDKEGDPTVAIGAKNTGDSPARDFKWFPSIQYFSGEKKRTETVADLGDAAPPGATIPAGEEHRDNQQIGYMCINEFAESFEPHASRIPIRVRIRFTFKDVFGCELEEYSFFIGISIATPNNVVENSRIVTKLLWNSASLGRVTVPRDWD